jgi:hypothetical protein
MLLSLNMVVLYPEKRAVVPLLQKYVPAPGMICTRERLDSDDARLLGRILRDTPKDVDGEWRWHGLWLQ